MNRKTFGRGPAAALAAAMVAAAFAIVPALPASAAPASAPTVATPGAIDLNGLDATNVVIGQVSGVCDDGTTALDSGWVKINYAVVDSAYQVKGNAWGYAEAIALYNPAHAWAYSGTSLNLPSMGVAVPVVGDSVAVQFTCHSSNWSDPPEVISASTYIPFVDTTPPPAPVPTLSASGTVYYPAGFDPAGGLGTVTGENQANASFNVSASVSGYDPGTNSATFTVDLSAIAASINVTNRWYWFRFDGPGFSAGYFPADTPTPVGGSVAMNLGSVSGIAFHPQPSSTPPNPTPNPPADPPPAPGADPNPATSEFSVVVDGIWGRQTILALQRALGVEADGVFGPISTRALQSRLDAKGFAPGPVDGFWGPLTTAALQRQLASLGYNLGPWGVDGAFGPASIRALQQALNAGRL